MSRPRHSPAPCSCRSNRIMAAGFLPDSRNSGGRKAIADQLSRHRRAVLLARPAIDTRTRQPPHPKPRSNLVPMDEVTEAFRRVAKVSLEDPDPAKPHTFGMAQQLSFNRARKQQSVQQEHQSNIKHMLRRIRALDSVTCTQEPERKKNPSDPFANPALFFRRPEDMPSQSARLTVPYSQAPPNYPRPVTVPVPKPKPRPQSAQSLPKPSTPPPTSDTPEVHVDDPDPQSTLQSQLLDIIIALHVYTDQDLAQLYARTRLRHPHISSAAVEAAISTVQAIIDG